MSGSWIFVCGPSGAGKDSVISLAQQIISERKDIVFARRMVTRPAQIGSDHDPVTESEFQALVQAGELRWHWQAHGFYYGIAQHYAAVVQAGRMVVINGSRAHVQALPPSPDMRLIQITAGSDQLAHRLSQRGRDTASAITERMTRNTRFKGLQVDYLIVNDRDLATAGKALADCLMKSKITGQLHAQSVKPAPAEYAPTPDQSV